jgi:hypothetical protein
LPDQLSLLRDRIGSGIKVRLAGPVRSKFFLTDTGTGHQKFEPVPSMHHMPNPSTIIKRFFQQWAVHLHNRYMALVSYLNAYRVRKERQNNQVNSIENKEKNYILLVTSNEWHFSSESCNRL